MCIVRSEHQLYQYALGLYYMQCTSLAVLCICKKELIKSLDSRLQERTGSWVTDLAFQ